MAPAASALAEETRRARARWAAPGSGHDRLIAITRFALPAAIGVLTALLAVAPLTSGRDISFVLAKENVAVARERMRVTEAVYRGADAKGQAFSLRAGSAVQATSRDPVVKLSDLSARLALADGPAEIVAGQGRYDMTAETVAVDGPVRFTAAGGYRLDTRDVGVDLKTRRVRSRGEATGAMPLGTFRADRLSADLNARTVQLDGRVRLHIRQRRGR